MSAAAEHAVWINGALCRGSNATISIFDRGARDGEGLFETLRVQGGEPVLWKRHLERLVVSAAELGFPVPPEPGLLRSALDQVLEAMGIRDAVARITVTRGIPGNRPARAGAWVEAEPLEARIWKGARTGEVRAVFASTSFEPGSLGRHKTTSRLSYSLARDEARAAHADEALLVSTRGEVLEGSVSNLFAVIRGAVCTPPLSAGILPGIVRAWVLEACASLGLEARERSLRRDDLEQADEVFLTNSVQEIVPVAQLEGRRLTPGEIALRLLRRYREEASRPVNPL